MHFHHTHKLVITMVDKKLEEALEKDGHNLEAYEREIAQKITDFIQTTLKVLRFIDSKIVTGSYYTATQTGLKNQLEYYTTNGILVYRDIHDARVVDEEPSDIDFPDGWNVPRPQYKQLKGTLIYLTREGTLVKFRRTGREGDEDNIDPLEYEYHLEDAQEISPLEVIKLYGDFEEQFMSNFISELKQTLKENPNKAPIFKNVIQYLKEPPGSMLLSVPIDLMYRFEPLASFLPETKDMTRDSVEKGVIAYLQDAIKRWDDEMRADAKADRYD